uniref:Putative secreted protein n=1 Tax=Anopheles marajoara TaxID=58244 RepID=A0A2M4C9K3_9DIPT
MLLLFRSLALVGVALRVRSSSALVVRIVRNGEIESRGEPAASLPVESDLDMSLPVRSNFSLNTTVRSGLWPLYVCIVSIVITSHSGSFWLPL